MRLTVSRLIPALLSILVSASFTRTASAAEYQVDSVHSSVVFSVVHFNTSRFYGRFNEVSGTIVFDQADPAAGSVELEIRSESVDTKNERRDRHLRSADFFDANQFPVIRFESTSVRALGNDRYEVTGNLLLHGVSKSVTLEVEKTGSGKHPRSGQSLIGFETRLTLERSDFGMSYMQGPLSNEVRLIIALEAGAGD